MDRNVSVLVIDPDAKRALGLAQAVRSSGWKVYGVTPNVDYAGRMVAGLPPTAALVDIGALPARDPESLVQFIDAGVIPIVMHAEDGPFPALELLARLYRAR